MLSLKTDGNSLSISNNQNTWEKKTLFFKEKCRIRDRIFKSLIQWYGSPDRDPYQNVTDPEHWLEAKTQTEGEKQKERQ